MINFNIKKNLKNNIQLKNKIIETILEKNKKIQDYNTNNKLKNDFFYYNSINTFYNLKNNYNSIIPLNIYQTWYSKVLPPKMLETCNLIKSENPEFNYYLYDDNDCREFIKNNFEKEILNAYDNLIPGAYRADLWRYCILYKNGGIYLDIKFKCANNFKLIELTEKEHFVQDRNPSDIYNALLVTKPGNEIMLKCIHKIVENVNNKYYGSNSLEPTGPHLICQYFSQDEINNMELKFNYTLNEQFSDYYILYNNTIILRFYKEYVDERKLIPLKHYSVYWVEGNIYK
jgi:mannosyltransferase OCH1-like enzyme